MKSQRLEESTWQTKNHLALGSGKNDLKQYHCGLNSMERNV